jgi:phage-related protein
VRNNVPLRLAKISSIWDNTVMQEAQQIKPVVWVGDSKRRLKAFPEDVQDEIGFALNRAQWGRTHRNAKSLRGFSGVFEIVSDYAGNAYRAVYVVNLGDKLYVLHCFQKKSKRGIKTPKKEIDLVRRRFAWAKELAAKEAENE